jgi:hypothetical protein
METNDILQEYAQDLNKTAENTQQAESSFTSEPVAAEQTITEVQSAAPSEVSNESAYDSILSGKTNVQAEDIELPEQQSVESIETKTEFDSDDASGLEDVIDEDDFIKSKTEGKFESWEQIIEALETSQMPKFENELSESLYNMIAEGKIDEVVEVLGVKKFAEDMDNMAEEDILKAYIKVNNPDFDDDDIESEFEENYKIDEYQFDESKLKREQKKLTQRMRSDVNDAKEFFGTLAQEIKFPELSGKTAVQENPEDAEMDAMIQEYRSAYLNSLNGVENRIGSLPFLWKDEKANVSVNGKFDIPAQELSKYREAAVDLESYQVERYFKDGKYQSEKLVKELYLADNFDKILNSAISQAVNQTRLEMLKQSKNIQVEPQSSGTFKPNAAEEERSMLDQLFMGHLKRQL